MKKFIIIAALFMLVSNWAKIESMFHPPPDFSSVPAGHVVLYSTEWCHYCAKTRAFLRARNVQYDERDIEKSSKARREYHQLGGRGVPVMRIGEQTVHGFNPDRLEKALTMLAPPVSADAR